MLKIEDFVIRFRWAVIGVIVAITVFLGLQAKKVDLNADFSTYLNQEDPVVEQYNRMGDVFGGNSIGVALISTDNIFTAENLELVKKLTDVYRSVEGIAYVTSLTNVIDFRKTEWGLEVGKLLNQNDPPRTPQALADFKSYVMQKDRYEGNLVSADGTTTAIILRFAGGSSKAVSQFATAQRLKVVTDEVAPAETLPPNTGIYFGGMPFLMFNMAMNITNSLSVLVPLMLAGSVGIIFLSAFAIPRIVKNVDWSLCLKKGSGPFHAEMLLREKFGGSLPVQVLVEGDLKDPAVLSMMRTIERRLETIPRVSKSLSMAGIIF